MENSHKRIYLNIRAEQIKMQHDTINKGLFPNGYPLKDAHTIASKQLEMDSKTGKMRITIDELLLLSDTEAVRLIDKRMKEFYG